MGLFDDFRKGREQVHSAAGTSPSPSRDRGSPPRPPQGHDSKGPSPIKIGYYCPLDADAPGQPLYSHTERHILMLGLNGAGKSTRFLIELLATARNRSLVVFDIKGELAYQTADIRRRFSDVKIVNPLGVLNMPSDGYNLLSALDPQSRRFYDAAASIADALIEIEGGSGQYWSESAQGLLVALIMWEVLTAHAEGRSPSLFNVRHMLTEPDEYAPGDMMRRRPIKGLSVTAARMIASGNQAIASLAGRFVRQHGLNELAGIQSTASTQTEWMLSDRNARRHGETGHGFPATAPTPHHDLCRDGCGRDYQKAPLDARRYRLGPERAFHAGPDEHAFRAR